MKYYIVNVLGVNGYSFMVESMYSLSYEEVIDSCIENDLFDCEDDANRVIVDDLVYEEDIEQFKDCTYEIY